MPPSSTSMTGVVIVEDHDEFRQSLEFFLSKERGYRCRSFNNCEIALESMEQQQPHLVIMDIGLPEMNGVECTREITQRWTEVKVLICTVHEDDEMIFSALRAGAVGYLLKRSPINALLEAVDQVLSGGSPMSPAIARRVVQSFTPAPSKIKNEQLSDREVQVLDLMSKGLRVKEIANKLCVSTNTVNTHIRHIYEKLQVHGRVEALRKTGRMRF